MTINDNLLKKLEKLSAIKIEDSKRENVKKELENVLKFVAILDELDLKDSDLNNSSNFTPLRDDIPSEPNKEAIEIVFKNAPDVKENFFVVPKIID
ncbi:MAG: Asp-tRNA(Asn)/Glu-tRNA(Gln) amidotransferase subunit GatC [Campylobacter sp.]|nr:Asp-tRNA(Asn)/Glu-tRNA(Gln) amidotransferase subunit GatC [Campylobacter sp.]